MTAKWRRCWCSNSCKICAQHTGRKGCGATKSISNCTLLALQKPLLSSMTAESRTGTSSRRTFCWTRPAIASWQISALQRLAAPRHGLVLELLSTTLQRWSRVVCTIGPWTCGPLVVSVMNSGQGRPGLLEESMKFSVPLQASIRLVQIFQYATAQAPPT